MGVYKFTAARGKDELKDIAVAAGAPEAQTDTVSINIDATKLTRFEAEELIGKIVQAIHAGKWPPL
jgi:hypothetical protein